MRLLVTLRDVTDLRQLQKKAQEQNDVLEVLAETLNIAPQRFVDFLLDARDTVSQCESLLDPARVRDDKGTLVQDLFIPLHTLKGAARSLPVKRFTDVVHQTEQVLAEERGKALDAHAREKVREGVAKVRGVVELYSRVAQDMLNPSLSPEPLLVPSRNSSLEDVLSDITACLLLPRILARRSPSCASKHPSFT